MKKITFFLSLLCLICIGATAQSFTPTQNKAYKLKTLNRGWWKSAGTVINGTDNESEASLFTFIEHDSKYYIYSISDKKYVNSTLQSASVNSSNNKAALADMDLSMITNVTFQATSNTDFPVYIADQNDFYFNMGSDKNLFINTWKTLDDGNQLAIIEAADLSSDAASEAMTILTAPRVNITYNIKYNGETISTVTSKAIEGLAYPTIADNNPYNIYSGYPTGTVSGEATHDITFQNNYPFEISESFENAKWYTLGIHSSKFILSHTEGQTSMQLSRTTTDFADNDLWCFVGNGVTGFTIYNKAAGKDMILSSSTTMSSGNGQTTYPILTATPVPEGNNTLWKMTPGNTIDNVQGFYLGQAETGYRVNKRGDNLAYWSTGADAGSTLFATSENVAIQALVNSYEKALSYEGCVGTLTSAQVNELKTKTSYKEAAAFAEANAVKIDPAKYYTFESASPIFTDGQTRVLTAGTENIKWQVADKKNVNAIWKIQNGSETGKYAIQAVNAGNYAGESSFLNAFSYSETPSDYYFTKATDAAYNAAVFHIQRWNNANNQITMAMDGATPSSATATEGTIVSYNSTVSSCASGWVIREVNEIEVALNSVNGQSWTSIYLPFGVQLEDGVEAYYAANMGMDESETNFILQMEKVEAVPANTGVVLKGTANSYTLTIDNEVAELEGENMLTGTNVDYTFTDQMGVDDEWGSLGYMVWTLGCLNDQVGFYYPKFTEGTQEVDGTTFDTRIITLKANKAYFLMNNSAGGMLSNAKYFTLSFGKGENTGIQNTVAGQNEKDNIFFDLSGRRVQAPVKGIYVTGNGKKIYVK